jgi:hypothetical protein
LDNRHFGFQDFRIFRRTIMACNCIVIAREVWDTRDLATQVLDDQGGGSRIRLQTRFEPEDLNALEIALRLKDAQGGKVTVLTFGEAGSGGRGRAKRSIAAPMRRTGLT